MVAHDKLVTLPTNPTRPGAHSRFCRSTRRKRSVNHRVGRHRYLAASNWREERRSGDERAGGACACGHGRQPLTRHPGVNSELATGSRRRQPTPSMDVNELPRTRLERYKAASFCACWTARGWWTTSLARPQEEAGSSVTIHLEAFLSFRGTLGPGLLWCVQLRHLGAIADENSGSPIEPHTSQSAPTRTLPHKPSLAQIRKQAKELLNSYRAGKEAAVAEVERFERSPDPANFALADAQRVLGRAYGFSSC